MVGLPPLLVDSPCALPLCLCASPTMRPSLCLCASAASPAPWLIHLTRHSAPKWQQTCDRNALILGLHSSSPQRLTCAPTRHRPRIPAPFDSLRLHLRLSSAPPPLAAVPKLSCPALTGR